MTCSKNTQYSDESYYSDDTKILKAELCTVYTFSIVAVKRTIWMAIPTLMQTVMLLHEIIKQKNRSRNEVWSFLTCQPTAGMQMWNKVDSCVNKFTCNIFKFFESVNYVIWGAFWWMQAWRHSHRGTILSQVWRRWSYLCVHEWARGVTNLYCFKLTSKSCHFIWWWMTNTPNKS